jgi:hypothetical protein
MKFWLLRPKGFSYHYTDTESCWGCVVRAPDRETALALAATSELRLGDDFPDGWDVMEVPVDGRRPSSCLITNLPHCSTPVAITSTFRLPHSGHTSRARHSRRTQQCLGLPRRGRARRPSRPCCRRRGDGVAQAATNRPSATPDAREPSAHRRGRSALACGRRAQILACPAITPPASSASTGFVQPHSFMLAASCAI